ncbi:MAG: hypothetical protein ABFD81_07155 [Syntrophaceae bacterium]
MKISNVKLGIATPLSFPMVPSAFFESFICMEKPDFVYLRTSSGPIDEMRNELVRDAMIAGCTHLIMMDTDQVYEPNTITRLLAHKLPVVGCLVHRRYPPFDPILLKGEIGKYKRIEEWEPGGLVEVDATGTGCLLFDMEVFREMPAPWFKFRKHEDGSPIGEDIGFCSDLRKAGYRIFVDTSVPAGHLTQMIVNEGTWKLYRRMKDAEAKAHEVEHGILKTKTEEVG